MHDQKKYDNGKATRTAGIFILVLAIILPVAGATALIISNLYGPSLEYGQEVGGHLINARKTDHPVYFVEELKNAREGMTEIGLTPAMYGAYFRFGHTADKSMEWQFNRIDGIIQQAEDVAELCKNQLQRSNNGQLQFNDHCIERFNAMKSKMGWTVGDIARLAYHANYHPFLYFTPLWGILLFLTAVAGIIVGGVLISYGNDKMHEGKNGRPRNQYYY